MATKRGRTVPTSLQDQLIFASESTRGLKATNEDRAIETRLPGFGFVFSVFDGHGGTHCADFATAHIAPQLATSLRRACPRLNSMLVAAERANAAKRARDDATAALEADDDEDEGPGRASATAGPPPTVAPPAADSSSVAAVGEAEGGAARAGEEAGGGEGDGAAARHAAGSTNDANADAHHSADAARADSAEPPRDAAAAADDTTENEEEDEDEEDDDDVDASGESALRCVPVSDRELRTAMCESFTRLDEQVGRRRRRHSRVAAGRAVVSCRR